MDLMPDTPIIINSGDIHSLTPQNHSDPRGVSLIFPYEFMSQYGIDIDRIRFAYTSNPAVDQRLRQSLHRLADLGERRGTDPYCHLLCNAEIFNVLHLLMTYYQDSHNTPLSNRHVERSRELLAYMNRHYQENIPAGPGRHKRHGSDAAGHRPGLRLSGLPHFCQHLSQEVPDDAPAI